MATPAHREPCRGAEPYLVPGESFDVPNPLRQRTWIDGRGRQWNLRGAAPLSSKRAHALLRRSDVLVMHVYGGLAHEHAGTDRAGLIGDIESFWDGKADPMASFDFGEFRDDAGLVMVMAVEGC